MKIFLFVCGLIIGVNAYALPQCSVSIESTDQVSWNKPTITVSKQCKQFNVILKHTGHLDRAVMGHNWVLTKEADQADVLRRIIKHRQTTDYVIDDPRIIAHTALIGGGESATVKLDLGILELGQDYVYFCSYPEHVSLMQGRLIVVE